jgi:signal transduction histidine kinase
MFAAVGLRRQAQQLIAPLQLPEIWHTLRVAGLALAGFAIVGGLVVPAARFFPANVLNEDAVFAWTAVPIAIYRGALALVLTWAVLRSLDVFREEVDRQIASLHAESALATERERFRRELHDGTLQTVYAAGLLLRSVERSAGTEHDAAAPLIQRSIDLLDVAVADMRQALGQVQPEVPQQSLGEELAALIKTRHLEALVDVTLDVQLSHACVMAGSRVAAIATIAGEALSNVVRHARASRVEVRASSTDQVVILQVQDNGRGFDAGRVAGSGLRNMRDRARLLGGDLRVVPVPGGGTLVELRVPCAEGSDAMPAVPDPGAPPDPDIESAGE